MNEATQTQETATTTTESQATQPSPTLEDVYKEFNVSIPAASSPQQTTQIQQQPPVQQQIEVPDAIQEPEKFKSWMAQQASAQSALMNSYQQVSGLLTKFQQDQHKAALVQDISKAVDIVNESVNLPDNQKPLIEFAIEAKARSDPRFLQIWNNRAGNPIAWGRALQAFSHEAGEMFSVKVDPQLRQDRQALKISQQQSATTKTDQSDGPDWGKQPADSLEFQQAWQRAARGYQ